jgi:anti-sigma factor RsiW
MGKPQDIEFELSQLLDGQLSGPQAARLWARIQSDPQLAQEFERYQGLEAKLQEQHDQLPDVNWELQREGIRTALEREELLEPARSVRPTILARWAAGITAAAAAIILAVFGGYRLLSPSGPRSVPGGPQVAGGPSGQSRVVVAYESPAPSALAVASLARVGRPGGGPVASVQYVDGSSPTAEELVQVSSAGPADMVLISVGDAAPRPDPYGLTGVFGDL